MSLKQQLNKEFPELTAIFAIGGTRTTYCLYKGSATIDDFDDYRDYMLSQYKRLISDYINLGGKHLIIPALSWQSFTERGEKYSRAATGAVQFLLTDEMIAFYQQLNLRVRFSGIDTLLTLPSDSPEGELAQALFKFNQDWQEGCNYLIWEIAPIPSYTISQAKLDIHASSLEELHDGLYQQLTKIAYGLDDIPQPNLYIGSARNGDIKLRSMMPFAIAAGMDTRFYYLPYPSLMMQKEGLETILWDLLEDVRDRAPESYDYEEILTPESIVAKRLEFQNLIDENSIIGLRHP